MARNNANPGADLIAAERRALAVEYRKMGASYREIADILTHQKNMPCSHEQARRDVLSALKTLAKEEKIKTAQLRQLELLRLDGLLKALWKMAASGNITAIYACLAVTDRRMRLLGLETAIKHEITGKDGGAIQTEVTTRVILPSLPEGTENQ